MGSAHLGRPREVSFARSNPFAIYRASVIPEQSKENISEQSQEGSRRSYRVFSRDVTTAMLLHPVRRHWNEWL